jgi:hypothetical protein
VERHGPPINNDEAKTCKTKGNEITKQIVCNSYEWTESDASAIVKTSTASAGALIGHFTQSTFRTIGDRGNKLFLFSTAS